CARCGGYYDSAPTGSLDVW
nr:immunoglobulin heavy chain junction region [Macaca mulatta]MOW46066.1 immunoglobulin heavy chain junction region [Macaca mulatta]MOW46591.1 immunoglobulin heavy chain junction region [Macaca mulatta]MOW46783.1 immunoglobulin heavy chain junction region [Macaca mulatta]MOW46940.1 immunoglobulin heavy chain junction region [Macaca mulatta]